MRSTKKAGARTAGALAGAALLAALGIAAPAFAADAGKANNGNPSGAAHERGNGDSSQGGGASGTGASGNNAGGNGARSNSRPPEAPEPDGNAGTVKIDGVPFDDGHGNEPHVDCLFRVVFYGFASGRTAAVTFTAQPPTGTQVLRTDTVALENDGAGGGNDFDGARVYDLTAQLAPLPRQSQQGWHVRLTVDTNGSEHGGEKHKVFWVDCPAPAPAAASGTAGRLQAAGQASPVAVADGSRTVPSAAAAGAGAASRTKVLGSTFERATSSSARVGPFTLAKTGVQTIALVLMATVLITTGVLLRRAAA